MFYYCARLFVDLKLCQFFFIHFHMSSGMHVKSVFTSAMKRVLASTKYASLWSDWRKKIQPLPRQLKINKLVTRTLSHQELYDWQYKIPIGSDPKNCLFIIMSISWGKKFACEFWFHGRKKNLISNCEYWLHVI